MREITQEECVAVYGGDCEDVGEFAAGFSRSLLTAAGAAIGASIGGTYGAIAGAAIGNGLGAATQDEIKELATQACESRTQPVPKEPPPREPDPRRPDGGGFGMPGGSHQLLVPKW